MTNNHQPGQRVAIHTAGPVLIGTYVEQTTTGHRIRLDNGTTVTVEQNEPATIHPTN